jgi:hypothetical protein
MGNPVAPRDPIAPRMPKQKNLNLYSEISINDHYMIIKQMDKDVVVYSLIC